ncbi:hypothetical protein MSAN_00854700 [Mycena sanguinolenta]|uniref:Uncharacterized protein n=1 Tax=Mycena sanguinolenta TaxID=230812 RepID=A0A8H7DA49_9AGAR|nr:hypothetical protein MSAN_00854700 [Mycena sanguinolenta]
MNRALDISEIVQVIVSQLDDPRTRGIAGTGRMFQLAALAQCRIFHEPALDALWRQKNTIRNLFNCMSDGLWACEVVDATPTMWLRRPIQVADWDRALHYSHRIKSLGLQMHGRESLSEVVEAARATFPGDYLLPQLESLHWNPGKTSESLDIDLFLGPRITSKTLAGLRIQDLPILETLSHRFPGLSKVLIGWSAFHGNSPIWGTMPVDFTAYRKGETAFSLFAHGLQNVRSLRLDTGIDIGATCVSTFTVTPDEASFARINAYAVLPGEDFDSTI